MLHFDKPVKFFDYMLDNSIINSSQRIILDNLWDTLVHNLMMDKSTPTFVWMNRFGNDKVFNFILKNLSEKGYIISSVENNFAELKLNPDKWGFRKDEFNHDQYLYKLTHYLMVGERSVLNKTVQINNQWKETGLVRNGFMRSGNFHFKYDINYVHDYKKYIAHNIYQELHTSLKEVKYEEIVSDLIGLYYELDGIYTLGNCVMDSRGRAIYQCTSKVFNPISHKDARACLIMPSRALDHEGLRCVYAFIAELLGYRGKNIEDKIRYGQNMYIIRELPSLDEMIEKNDFSDLHVLIWLRRIYENLNDIEHWVVPIELDATASQLQITSVLLNDHTYMDLTNLINPDEFKDAWTIEGLTRTQVKKAVTPRLYGSGREPKELWSKHKLPYTQEQINIITKEIRSGRYARANNFKDFIINNVHPYETMNVHVGNDKFNIECNRFKLDLLKTENHTVYTSAQRLFKECVQHTESVPDLDRFKTYFQTLLIHGLDSQVANAICESKELDWVLPNHDAFLVHPNDGIVLRKLYTKQLMNIYKNRETILKNYFNSIGIQKPFALKEDTEIEEFSGYCLK
jgi:hypothetical protein